MDSSLTRILVAALTIGGALYVVFRFGARRAQRDKLGRLAEPGRFLSEAPELDDDQEVSEEELQEQKFDQVKKSGSKKRRDPTIDEQLFMAGRFLEHERLDFQQKRMLAPPVFGILGLIGGVFAGDSTFMFLGPIIGVIVGLYLPLKVLSGWIEQHREDISFYLPLVIEQIAIGVSSSLDIGPCLAQIVQMADERKNHNAVTRLLKYAQFQMRSGVSLEEALIDIGRQSGVPELKHVLLALSQVAKFGGEVSKQLEDLADSVSNQREAHIEARIRKLELKATGPVGLVFLAYLIILGSGMAANFIKVLG